MKQLLSYDFQFIQNIEPVCDRTGQVQKFYPQEKYANGKQLELNKYGNGAFCRFSINPMMWSCVSGVYAYFIDDELVYIGQALNLAERFNQGYGSISARACFTGGQSTNCKINKIVLEAFESGQTVALYFCTTGDFHRIERDLIGHYNPKYNSALRTDQTQNISTKKTYSSELLQRKSSSQERGMTSNPSVHEVRSYIQKLIESAKSLGKHEITIRSGEIHSALNMTSAMPTVCSAMRTLPGNYLYTIIDQPPKGNGSWLVFKYTF
jgi:hypothetical protein